MSVVELLGYYARYRARNLLISKQIKAQVMFLVYILNAAPGLEWLYNVDWTIINENKSPCCI